MTNEFAKRFATDWIEAWNSHDLYKILSHYADDFEMSSPYIRQIAGEPSGMLKGKAQVAAYWAQALQQIPDLHFELLNTLAGVDSLVIYYQGVKGAAAEVLHFDSADKVIKAYAHYS
jgi:ketosteroid isomerase-like protein